MQVKRFRIQLPSNSKSAYQTSSSLPSIISLSLDNTSSKGRTVQREPSANAQYDMCKSLVIAIGSKMGSRLEISVPEQMPILEPFEQRSRIKRPSLAMTPRRYDARLPCQRHDEEDYEQHKNYAHRLHARLFID